MAIYVKFAEEKKPKTVLGFLNLFYSRVIGNYCVLGQFTYHDKECKLIQDNNKYRSFDDLLDLIQTYYPSTKPSKLMHYLLILKIELPGGGVSKPHLGFCSQMGRIRYIPWFCSHYSGIKKKMTKSKYTWQELLSPLGINNEQEFLEYIK